MKILLKINSKLDKPLFAYTASQRLTNLLVCSQEVNMLMFLLVGCCTTLVRSETTSQLSDVWTKFHISDSCINISCPSHTTFNKSVDSWSSRYRCHWLGMVTFSKCNIWSKLRFSFSSVTKQVSCYIGPLVTNFKLSAKKLDSVFDQHLNAWRANAVFLI